MILNRVVLRHLETTGVAEVCVHSEELPLSVSPAGGLGTKFTDVVCGCCGDELPVRIYTEPRLRLERTAAAIGLAVLWPLACYLLIRFAMNHLFSDTADAAEAAVFGALALAAIPLVIAVILTRRALRVSRVSLRAFHELDTRPGGRRHEIAESE